jgi:hypothetical protein
METITNSGGGQKRGPDKDPPEHDLADSSICSGLRTLLRLEQRLLRSKDGNGLWWAKLSSETTLEIQDLHSRPQTISAIPSKSGCSKTTSSGPWYHRSLLKSKLNSDGPPCGRYLSLCQPVQQWCTMQFWRFRSSSWAESPILRCRSIKSGTTVLDGSSRDKELKAYSRAPALPQPRLSTCLQPCFF